jgi:hypothetical protein
VISKLDVKIHTQTPPEGSPEHPDPWVSETPKTTKEIECQSEYIERRIRRHKSSSPDSIITALTSLAKGLCEERHKNALLMDRIHELQAANEILSRHRSVKRKRLINGGAMTVGEAQASIDQMDVDKQVVVESSQRGG